MHLLLIKGDAWKIMGTQKLSFRPIEEKKNPSRNIIARAATAINRIFRKLRKDFNLDY